MNTLIRCQILASLSLLIHDLIYLGIGRWILGANSHICFNQSAFYTMKTVKNAGVNLPYHKRIPINFAGTVKFSNDLISEDVLHIPQFKFSLKSVSSLTKDSYISVNFFTNTCYPRDAPPEDWKW